MLEKYIKNEINHHLQKKKVISLLITNKKRIMLNKLIKEKTVL
jgi:hypothetical protein